MGLSMFGIWLYGVRSGFLKEELCATLKTISRYYLLAAILLCLIFILSFINVWLCLALSGIMFIIFLFPEQAIGYVSRVGVRSAD
jgi:hypothetical protein